MATRLYPKVSVETLERLAGVPAGTHDWLVAVRNKYPPPGEQGWEQAQRYFVEVGADPDLDTLDNFLTCGWGRLSLAASKVIEAAGLDYIGVTTDRQLIRRLLEAQGVVLPPDVSPDDIREVYWL